MKVIFDLGPLITTCILNKESEEKLHSLYQQYQKGEISLGYLAKEMGSGRREVEEFLQERGLKVTNI